MLARTLRQRGLAWLQLAAPATPHSTALGSSSGLLGSAGSSARPQHQGLLAAAARRSSSSTGAASEAAAKEAAAEAAAAEAAAPRRRGRPSSNSGAAEAAADVAATRRGRKQAAPAAAPAAVRRGTVVLVESPAKAKKIQGFLGPDYNVSGGGAAGCTPSCCSNSVANSPRLPRQVLSCCCCCVMPPTDRCWPAMVTCGTCRPSRGPSCPTKASGSSRGQPA